ncbi:hypothetical protein RSAG8_05078, partial [Rhizoctonia solani AG-8 WAC10335]
MAASDDIYFDYYTPESLSSKWGSILPFPTRRIQIIPPNAIDTKSSSLGGPPPYDPSSMSHTQQKLFRRKLLYVAPLAYYALRTLRPWCFGTTPNDETFSSCVTVSTTEGEERVNLGDILAPWAKSDISLLDPATWVFLIQLYNGLPKHYSRYKLALNDPYLPMLSTIPSTPKFSIITVLDLSNWPQPQFGIPALIQDLKAAAYSIVTERHEPNDELQRPWIVHIDRQYPSDWGLQRKPHWKPAPSENRLPWYSDGYSDVDMLEADGLFIDGDDFGNDSGSAESFDEAEADLSPSEVDPSSPLEPTSSIFGGDETSTLSRVGPISIPSCAINNAAPSGTSDSNASNTQPPSRSIISTAASQLSPTDPNQLVVEVIAHESAGPAPGVPHFYGARAQAGLAPPKARKRRRRYSSASSESYDSDEEREKEEKMEAELQRRQMEDISDKDWQLMLLREPPEWSAAETLIATVRTWKQHQSQNTPTPPDLSSAKKRKAGTGEAAARWAQIIASRKRPSQSATPQHTNATSLGTSSQIHPPIVPTSTPGDRVPVRRTTLGRAPRPPGTIVRKPH